MLPSTRCVDGAFNGLVLIVVGTIEGWREICDGDHLRCPATDL